MRPSRRLSPRAAVARALDDLPEHEREALELRVVDELPYGPLARWHWDS